jgi:branched-chain amino acid transport system substrate-binding protein
VKKIIVFLITISLVATLILSGCAGDEGVEGETKVTGVSPSTGNPGQTLDVVVTGAEFTDASVVSFGSGLTVNSFTVDSATKITADITIADTATAGSRDVSVTSPAGTGTKSGGFTIEVLEPIKIGFLAPFSGAVAAGGDEMYNGFYLFFDQMGWEIAGREIELIKGDTAYDPATALEQTRRLVETDKVDMLTGTLSSAVALAIRDYVDSQEIPLIVCAAATTDLAFEEKSDYIVRVSHMTALMAISIAKYAYEELGYRELTTMALDYQTGHELVDILKTVFEELGGQVVQEQYVPFGTQDFGPYLLQVDPADGMFAVFYTQFAINFLSQFDEFGLKESHPLFGPAGLYETASKVPASRDAVVGGIVAGSTPEVGSFDTPESTSFASDFMDMYGFRPTILSSLSYSAGQMIAKALEATNGDIEDALEFLEAVKNAEVMAPHGPISIEAETNSAIVDMKVQEMVEQDGEIFIRVLKTYEHVSPSDLTPYL